MARHSPSDSWTAHEDRLFDLAVQQESSGTAEPTDPSSDSEPARRTINGYRILRKLGDGGMGVVYAAQQNDPYRIVALKILRGGQFADKHQVRLFERETRTLARLKHPGIATLYETGRTDEGEQFFAMELIEGIPPTKYARIHQLATSARLDLFRRICEAVEHAHQRGVIHRDLKPSNILVDAHGHPKVLDFGLAKITESDVAKTTMVTEVGRIQGTLPYMSPEQARGKPDEIDLRSDIYSLGVLLYELLTEQLPYDTDRTLLHEAVRVICEELPCKMSTINRTLRGDLETIALKALEKDPDRRYQSAGALSDDLRRYLASEPILARPPSTWYMLRKFSRRNLAVVIGVATAFVLLIGGIAGTSWQAVRATRQRDRALLAEQQAEQVVAFQASQLGEINPEQMGIRLREDLLRELRAAISSELPSEDAIASSMERLEDLFSRANFTNVALQTLDRNIFERALAAVAEQFADQPLVKARLLQTLAGTLTDLGLLERAVGPQIEALEIRTRLLGDEHLETTNSMNSMGSLLESQGKLEEAEAYYRKALDAKRRLSGDGHETTLVSGNLGTLLARQGKPAEAEPYFREVLAANRIMLGDEHPDTLTVLSDLGFVLNAQQEWAEADSCYQEVLATRRRVLGDDHPDTFVSINNMGSSLWQQGKLASAKPYFLDLLDGFRRVLGDDHPNTLTAINNVGVLLKSGGQLEEAEPYFREVLDSSRRTLGDEHPDTLSSMKNMGSLLMAQGKLGEAEPLLRDALAGRRRVLGKGHVDTLSSINILGSLLIAQGRFGESASLLRDSGATDKRVHGDGHWRLAEARSLLGESLTGLGRFAEAEPLLLEGHAGLDSSVTPRRRPETLPPSVERLVRLYEAWHDVEPEKGYDANAVTWRAKLGD